MRFFLAVFLAAALHARAAAADDAGQAGPQPARRARPPVWSPEVLGVFFDDARTVLVGPRPDYASAAAGMAARQPGAEASGTPTPTSLAPSSRGDLPTARSGPLPWSKLIDADTIETEVKRLSGLLGVELATRSAFTGGGFRNCQEYLGTLAVLFAVAGDYDGRVRWQDAAPDLRELFAQAGFACTNGGDAAYQAATARRRDLDDLIRGDRPEMPTAESEANWGRVAARPAVMRRVERSHTTRMKPWMASLDAFATNRIEVRQEAQMLAVLSAAIQREGFADWNDPEYASLAAALQHAATDLAAAAESNDYIQASSAFATATQACTDCHAGYR